jgi:hypothetical protein
VTKTISTPWGVAKLRYLIRGLLEPSSLRIDLKVPPMSGTGGGRNGVRLSERADLKRIAKKSRRCSAMILFTDGAGIESIRIRFGSI